MSRGIPDFDIPTPKFLSDLVELPYQKGVFLCPQTHTRWKYDQGALNRDHDGELEWEEMAGYVDKDYLDVFLESYRFALEGKE